MNSNNPQYIWMNGTIVNWEDARIHVLTHALHYGTAVFEGIRAYPSDNNLNIFRLQDHINRMIQSSRIYYIDQDYSSNDLVESTIKLVRKNNLHSRAYIRPIIYVGYKSIGLNFSNFPIDVAIIAIPFGNYFENSTLRLRTSSWRKFSEQSTPPLAKASGNYLNSVLAKLEAVRDGYDDAIMLDSNGFISEGTGENIFVVKDDELITPPYTSSILRGITRDTIIHLASDFGYTVKERQLIRFELYNSDEAFFSGTAAEITPIIEVDKRKINDGKLGNITSRISNEYTDLVTGKNAKYSEWLTPIY